jgi:hypothetical protein
MFDPYPHEADLYKQGELNPSPSNSNELSMWTDLLLQCIAHIPK